jgi:hypothetical protein
MRDGLSIEEQIADAVDARVKLALAPVVALLEQIKRALPPQLADVARAAEVTGLSEASIRRRVSDGTISSVRVGGRILVDLTSPALRPTSDAEIEKLARDARSGS